MMSSTSNGDQLITTEANFMEDKNMVNSSYLKDWNKWIMLQGYLIMSIGLCLNLITAAAYVKSSLLSKGKPSHQLIFNVTMSDIASCLGGQAFAIFQYTTVGQRYVATRKLPCIAGIVGVHTGFDSTINALLLISLERLFAISSPLHHMHKVTRGACRIAIVISWTLVIVKNAVPFFWNQWQPFFPCNGLFVYTDAFFKYLYNSYIYGFMAAIVTVNILLGGMVIISTRKRTGMNASESLTKTTSASELKIVRIVLMVVCVLVITWIPITVLANIIFAADGDNPSPFSIFVAFNMCRGFSLLGVVTDPIIYFANNEQCRSAVLSLLGLSKTKKKRQQMVYSLESTTCM
jgi:hypothetical protein